MLYILMVVMVIWVNTFVKMYRTIHLKLIHFIHVQSFQGKLLPCGVKYICFQAKQGGLITYLVKTIDRYIGF